MSRRILYGGFWTMTIAAAAALGWAGEAAARGFGGGFHGGFGGGFHGGPIGGFHPGPVGGFHPAPVGFAHGGIHGFGGIPAAGFHHYGGSDEKFTWNYTVQGQTRTIQGTYTYAHGVLTLIPQQGPPIVAQVTWQGENRFRFKLAGSGPDDPGLTFTR
jgi:hypothetical protein